MYICNPFFSLQRLAFEQLKNGSSRPGASEAADRGKHAYPVVVASTPPCLLIPWSHDVTDCSTANAFSLKKGGAIAPFAPPWLRHCKQRIKPGQARLLATPRGVAVLPGGGQFSLLRGASCIGIMQLVWGTAEPAICSSKTTLRDALNGEAASSDRPLALCINV